MKTLKNLQSNILLKFRGIEQYWIEIFFLSGVCVPYSLQACEDAVAALGLQKGGPNGYSFVGNYSDKGCYTYNYGDYTNVAFYGTGGSFEEMSNLYIDKGVYRPFGYDCQTNGNI